VAAEFQYEDGGARCCSLSSGSSSRTPTAPTS
jgi:hypothetical protein